jgi:hypothetical protein
MYCHLLFMSNAILYDVRHSAQFKFLYQSTHLYLLYIIIPKLGTGCKDTLVICNSIFFIFLSQIKTQRDQKIIVWVQYFPYKYSFKVISND